METFECSCGFKISVEWDENEITKDVPCGVCFWEEWFFNEETKQTEKIIHGNTINCIKGNGI